MSTVDIILSKLLRYQVYTISRLFFLFNNNYLFSKYKDIFVLLYCLIKYHVSILVVSVPNVYVCPLDYDADTLSIFLIPYLAASWLESTVSPANHYT